MIQLAASLRRNSLKAIEVRSQRGGDNNGPVGLLIIFNNRNPRSAHGKAAAVQGMEQFRLAGLAAAEAKICAPRLKCFEVGARRNFPETRPAEGSQTSMS